MRKYTSEITQQFLTEINDGDSLLMLQARKWNTTQGKIDSLKKYIDITTEQAKAEIKKWLIS